MRSGEKRLSANAIVSTGVVRDPAHFFMYTPHALKDIYIAIHRRSTR